MSDTNKKELEIIQKKPLETTDGEPTRQGIMYTPVVDIVENRDAITLYADLPGVDRNSIDIDVRDGVLSLTATVAPPSNNWQTAYREYQPGGFSRRFTLGERIDTDKINAQMDNGVLTLVLPKTEQHKPRKIQIG